MAEMVNLYYTSKQNCREDCDTLGIDRRRVISLRREARFETTVIQDNGSWVRKPVVAMLRVKPELIEKAGGPDRLYHDDDETTW